MSDEDKVYTYSFYICICKLPNKEKKGRSTTWQETFRQRVKDVLGYSREEAERLQNSYIGPEHLLLGILRDGSGKADRRLCGISESNWPS